MKIARAGGFTLVEMMMALLVLAVLLAVAAPGFYELIKNNRMLSQVYAMRAALNGARSEALAQRSFVTLCHSEDGATCGGDWNEGYVAFVDADGDGAVDDPNSPTGDRVFFAKVVDSDTLEIDYSGGDRVLFDSRGYTADSSQGIFTFCEIRGSSKARGVVVGASGMVRAMDPNEPVTCP